jgi:hypothetical protein
MSHRLSLRFPIFQNCVYQVTGLRDGQAAALRLCSISAAQPPEISTGKSLDTSNKRGIDGDFPAFLSRCIVRHWKIIEEVK